MRRFPSRTRCFLSCAVLVWAPWALAQATLSGSVTTPDGIGVPQLALGVDGFGQSGTRPDLYRHYGIDAEAIVGAATVLLGG